MPAKLPAYNLLCSTCHSVEVSRRAFLSLTTGAVVSMLPTKAATFPSGKVFARADQQADCVLLSAQEHCALPESVAGYESALTAAGVRPVKASAGPLPHAKSIIIPACSTLPPEATCGVAEALKDGSWVVLESGAGFAMPKDFAAHQGWLESAWSVKVKAPVGLWKHSQNHLARPGRRLAPGSSPVAPYVDFHWPVKVKVRDFSYVIPVSPPPQDVVGRCEEWPIASKQTIGKGTLVFLGSPVGPALWAGDAEAHRWLREFIGILGL